MNNIAKKAFLQRDRVVKAMTADGHFRLAAIKNTKAVQTAQANHRLSALATLLLGRTMSAASLLAAFLKNEERVIVELLGNGVAEKVFAEAVQVGEVRGFVGNPQCTLDFSNPATKLSDGIGVGLVRVSRILYGNYEPVVGLVELVAGDVSTDIAYYLSQSEQIPSAVLLDVTFDNDGSVLQSGGLMVQALPGAPERDIVTMVDSLQHLDKLPELFTNSFSPEEVLRLVTPAELEELDNIQVDFFCRCTLERFKATLSTLGIEEIRDMKASNQRELVCRYCNKHYTLSDKDFEDLFVSLQAREN
jgi:molecular chaperone Hsp33